MNRISLSLIAITTLAISALFAAPAYAQATRTWVSGVGDDANPCSRTAPCKTFAGAISKTAAGGEISVLDPGGFGAVTITKSITINGDGTLAGILAAGTNGIIINAGVNDKVIIRNLSINGAGTGIRGIHWLAGAQLTVDKVSIYGFTTNAINVAKSTDSDLYVRDTYITNTNAGIVMTTSAGFVTASIDNVRLDNLAGNGIEAVNNVVANANNTIIASSSANAVIVSGGSSIVAVTNSQLYSNITALNASVSGATIRVSNSNLFQNATAFNLAGGATIASGTNNKTAGNGGVGVPNATLGNQ